MDLMFWFVLCYADPTHYQKVETVYPSVDHTINVMQIVPISGIN